MRVIEKLFKDSYEIYNKDMNFRNKYYIDETIFILSIIFTSYLFSYYFLNKKWNYKHIYYKTALSNSELHFTFTTNTDLRNSKW